ncbi:MAG: hypothetical protein GC189_11300 [Alphaproteobacteria bacterium]|nr:hypothetical protein [Alphaproteobacteria bacterium]
MQLTRPRLDPGEIESLLDFVQWLLRCAYSVVGEPLELIAMAVVPRRTATHGLRYLRTLETLTRRLILAHAALLGLQAAPQRRRTARKPKRVARVAFNPEGAPETWRGVHFALTLPLERFGRARSRRTARGAGRSLSGASIARRIEAVRRVAENPAPYARRLALSLSRKPHMLGAQLRRPAAPPDDLQDRELREWDDFTRRAAMHFSPVYAAVADTS